MVNDDAVVISRNDSDSTSNASDVASDKASSLGNLDLTFEGLMVGRYNGSNIYEIGILPASGHAFAIIYQEFTGGVLTNEWKRYFYDFSINNRFWSFELVNSTPDAKVFYYGGPFNRTVRPNTADERANFKWAVTLEGDDCPDHPRPLTRKAGLLSPILHVKNGEFYNSSISMNKIYQSKRTQPGYEFGYVSQTVGVRFKDITKREEVVLTRGGEEIFRIPMYPMASSDKNVRVFFQNSPPHEHMPYPNEPSHFQFYYLLFDVEANNRYDFYDSNVDNRSTFDVADSSAMTGRGIPYPYRCGIGNLPTNSRPLD